MADYADTQPDPETLAFWQNNPPACPYCGSDKTWLFDVYFGQPVWACDNPECPNVEHEHFFDLADGVCTSSRPEPRRDPIGPDLQKPGPSSIQSDGVAH